MKLAVICSLIRALIGFKSGMSLLSVIFEMWALYSTSSFYSSAI